MRMWMVDPRKMCNKHLLGEHVETHMFRGTLLKGLSVKGYIDKGLFEFQSLYTRHEALVAEMQRRHMQHNSPLEELWGLTVPDYVRQSKVDPVKSEADLMARCERCRLCKEAFS